MPSTNRTTEATPSTASRPGCRSCSSRLTSPMFARSVDGGESGARLVARLLGLELRHAVCDDSRSRRYLETIAVENDGSDRDGEIEVRPARDVADGAAVGAARARLELAN